MKDKNFITKLVEKLVIKVFVRDCFLFFACIFLLQNCAEKKDPNDFFQRKYSNKVKEIAAIRTQSKEQKAETTNTADVPVDMDWANLDKSFGNSSEYAYVDVNKFDDNKVPQNFLPSNETYQQQVAKSPEYSLPPDIFEVAYNVESHPPYKAKEMAFDEINVPQNDAYGIDKDMPEKSYFLVGNTIMKQTVDQIRNNRTQDDVKISEMLIKEQRQRRRTNEMLNVFGFDIDNEVIAMKDESGFEVKNKKKTSKKKAAKKKITKKSNKTQIAQSQQNQVSQQNSSPQISGFQRRIVKN